ncbi:transposase [Cupriavidus necator]|uniref:transposase n=1 Tax=Cupriavidus necator TaxID=106590 RepID=UPI003F739CEF
MGGGNAHLTACASRSFVIRPTPGPAVAGPNAPSPLLPAPHRREVFAKEIIDDLRGILANVCTEVETDIVEIDGEDDHVHLSAGCTRKPRRRLFTNAGHPS